MSATADAVALLATEVLMRAFRDLKVADAQTFDDPETSRSDVSVRADAISFLTASTAEWQSSLETWCAYAGIDPNVVVAKATTFLDKGAIV